MNYRYFIKDKTFVDVEGLNKDFQKFKTEMKKERLEFTEVILKKYFSDNNLDYEEVEEFGDDGGVYLTLLNGGEFIFLEEIDNDNESELELIQEELVSPINEEKNDQKHEVVKYDVLENHGIDLNCELDEDEWGDWER
ncbi:MAG: hypothetical protein CVU99_09110 [Firmicutes bacterium HGW-Firmicutes-4]|jgi:hypothetical protein|nr:MAG: hypothetical protein CVU99_09110 [Firmicutes bacterium HGW-Firmicutes-4]